VAIRLVDRPGRSAACQKRGAVGRHGQLSTIGGERFRPRVRLGPTKPQRAAVDRVIDHQQGVNARERRHMRIAQYLAHEAGQIVDHCLAVHEGPALGQPCGARQAARTRQGPHIIEAGVERGTVRPAPAQ